LVRISNIPLVIENFKTRVHHVTLRLVVQNEFPFPVLAFNEAEKTLYVHATFSNMYDPAKWKLEGVATHRPVDIYDLYKTLTLQALGILRKVAEWEVTTHVNELNDRPLRTALQITDNKWSWSIDFPSFEANTATLMKDQHPCRILFSYYAIPEIVVKNLIEAYGK